jgi:excisionase family DNA binding protein
MKQTNKNTASRQFVTVAEIAAATGQCETTVRGWIMRGALPAVRPGRSFLIPRGSVEAMARLPLFRSIIK